MSHQVNGNLGIEYRLGRSTLPSSWSQRQETLSQYEVSRQKSKMVLTSYFHVQNWVVEATQSTAACLGMSTHAATAHAEAPTLAFSSCVSQPNDHSINAPIVHMFNTHVTAIRRSCDTHVMLAGSAPLEDEFWCSSPSDHVVHPFLMKKHNPFGAVSSPHASTPTSGQGPFADSPRGEDSPGMNDRRHSGQGEWADVHEGSLPQAALCHDQGLR